MKNGPLVLSYDNLVIGSSLEALYFAHYYKMHVLWTCNMCPLMYEKCEDFGLGDKPHLIWEQLSFQLSMGGYIPFDDRINAIYYLDSETLKIVTKQESIVHVKFKKLYVFDDMAFFDIPIESGRTTDKKDVFDIFTVGRIVGDHKELYPENSIIKSALPYKLWHKKYYLVKSEASIPAEIYLLKIRLLEELKKNKDLRIDKRSYILHEQRIIVDRSVGIHEDFDNVIFVYNDIATMYAVSYKRLKIDYMKYLRIKLGIEWKNI